MATFELTKEQCVGLVCMNLREQSLSLREASEMDLVNYLSKLGHEPTKIRNQDFWPPSPLQEERWHEHQMGKGGNLIDFGIPYHRCTVVDFLHHFTEGISFQQSTALPLSVQQKLIKINPNQPPIPIEIAGQPCCEISYKMNEDTYFSIRFKNGSNAWEIHNPYFKANSSPTGINTSRNRVDDVPAFERSMDFLSYKTTYSDLPESDQNYVTINSIPFFDRARFFTEEHRSIGLYLAYDATEILHAAGTHVEYKMPRRKSTSQTR